MSARTDKTLWSGLFRISPDSGQTLQSQIRQAIVTAILDRQMPVNQPLPSCRTLASRLKVARGTVVLALAAARPDLVRHAVVAATSSVVGRAAASFFDERIGQLDSNPAAFASALRDEITARGHGQNIDLELSNRNLMIHIDSALPPTIAAGPARKL